MLKVWDPLVRILHWSLVVGVAFEWITRHGSRDEHEAVGYAVLAVVALRILWGFLGTSHARFSDFVVSPSRAFQYGKLLVKNQEKRFVGHNPLGGWMIVALLLVLAVVTVSGWLYTTDAFWGVEWVAHLHLWSTYALLALVALHVAGVAFTSYRQRENLVAAMIHGRKRA